VAWNATEDVKMRIDQRVTVTYRTYICVKDDEKVETQEWMQGAGMVFEHDVIG
jgi:hypothetical protein